MSRIAWSTYLGQGTAPRPGAPKTRTMRPETLAQMCVCGKQRREHGGPKRDGACPHSRYGDGHRFRNANPPPPQKSHKPRRPEFKVFPSGGPWRILPDCPAETHNTARAAEGSRKGVRPVRPKCVCPRAIFIREERLKNWQNTRKIPGQPRIKLSAANPEPVERRMPDLSSGECQKPWNTRIATLGFTTQPTPGGETQRQEAKALCRSCPMLQVCQEYVLAEEKPAGSWGGVWGGLDPWNRRGRMMTFTDGGLPKLVPYVPA